MGLETSCAMITRWSLVAFIACIMMLTVSCDKIAPFEQVECSTSRTRFRSALIQTPISSSIAHPTPWRLPARVKIVTQDRPASKWPAYLGAFAVHHPSKYVSFAVIWTRQVFKLLLFFGIGLALLRSNLRIDSHLIICVADFIVGILTLSKEEKDVIRENSLGSATMLAYKSESLIVQRSVCSALQHTGNFNNIDLFMMMFLHAIAFSLMNAALKGYTKTK